MARTAEQALAWGWAQINHPTQSWYRQCLAFVRTSFDVYYRPESAWPLKDRNAGTSWDRAAVKHFETDPKKIPTGVPVHWETPGEADHVALSCEMGTGRCLSNDILDKGREGDIYEVPMDLITREWNATLKGWTEDLVGNTVYEKPVVINVQHTAVALNAHMARNAQPVENLLKVESLDPDGIGIVEAHYMRPAIEASTVCRKYQVVKRGKDGAASRELALMLHERVVLDFARYVRCSDGVKGAPGAAKWDRGALIAKGHKTVGGGDRAMTEKVAWIVTHFGFDFEENKKHVRKIKRIVKRLKAKGYVVWVLTDANSAAKRLKRVMTTKCDMYYRQADVMQMYCSEPFKSTVHSGEVIDTDHGTIVGRTKGA